MRRAEGILVALVLYGMAGATQAESPPYPRIVPAALLAEARFPEAQAVALAQAKVPDGRIIDLELEREDGKFVWAFELQVPGKRGHHEVEIDAVTGSVQRVAFEPM